MRNKKILTCFKSVLILFLIVGILLSTTQTHKALNTSPEFILRIDGQHTVNFDTTLNPFLDEDRVFVPINVFTNDLNYSVRWNSTFDGATLSNKQKEIIIHSGQNIVSVNGKERILEKENKNVFPILRYERIFVPIRFIVEEFGGEIEFKYVENEEPSQIILEIKTGNEVQEDETEVVEIEENEEERKEEKTNIFIRIWNSIASFFFSIGRLFRK